MVSTYGPAHNLKHNKASDKPNPANTTSPQQPAAPTPLHEYRGVVPVDVADCTLQTGLAWCEVTPGSELVWKARDQLSPARMRLVRADRTGRVAREKAPSSVHCRAQLFDLVPISCHIGRHRSGMVTKPSAVLMLYLT